MKRYFRRAGFLAGAAIVAMFSALSGGCVAGGGYGYYDDGYAPYGDYYDGGVLIGGDVRHHEHHEHDYRGWGRGYHVAPSRHGEHEHEHGEHEHFEHGGERGGFQHGGGRAFRSAPASHPMPSLPSRGSSGPRR
jgi:hypothetical protein